MYIQLVIYKGFYGAIIIQSNKKIKNKAVIKNPKLLLMLLTTTTTGKNDE